MLKLMLKQTLTGFPFHGRLHQFTSPLLHSTSENGINMAEFFVKSVGFSQDEAASISTNCKFKSTKNPHIVVDFLKSSGFDETHIRNLVKANPAVLRSHVDKTLSPKIRYFQELGLSGLDLGLIISRNPYIIGFSLKDHIVPCLEILKSIMGSNQQLVSLLIKTKSQKLLSSNVVKCGPDIVLLLQNYGLSNEKIKWLLLRNQLLLTRSIEWVEKIVKDVEEKLGIPRTSAMFVHGITALMHKSDDKIEKRRSVFRSHGWSDAQVSLLIRKLPANLSLSEKAVRAKLKYFMEEIGYDCDYLAAHPALLSYSMEKRIVPRTAVMQALKEKQLIKTNIGLYSCMCLSESKFIDKFMLPFQDEFPELTEYYIQKQAGSVTKT